MFWECPIPSAAAKAPTGTPHQLLLLSSFFALPLLCTTPKACLWLTTDYIGLARRASNEGLDHRSGGSELGSPIPTFPPLGTPWDSLCPMDALPGEQAGGRMMV